MLFLPAPPSHLVPGLEVGKLHRQVTDVQVKENMSVIVIHLVLFQQSKFKSKEQFLHEQF